MNEHHVSLIAPQLGNLPFTNTFFTSLLVVAGILLASYIATRNMKMVPSGIQNVVEWGIESLYNLFQSVTGDEKKTRLYFPLIATFFIFILVANYSGLFPGVGTIGYYNDHHELVPFFRSAASDLNVSLALGLFSVIAAHFYSIRAIGIKGYLGLWFKPHPILLFVGLIELVSEFTKIVSLSFRLFGNIFAGETVLEVISGVVTPYLAPLPFLGLELIVGFVQALVFSVLTLASLMILTTSHEESAEAH